MKIHAIKNLLINDPILQHPDFEKSFILTTDASNYADWVSSFLKAEISLFVLRAAHSLIAKETTPPLSTWALNIFGLIYLKENSKL